MADIVKVQMSIGCFGLNRGEVGTFERTPMVEGAIASGVMVVLEDRSAEAKASAKGKAKAKAKAPEPKPVVEAVLEAEADAEGDGDGEG